jgi:hypothetical protein
MPRQAIAHASNVDLVDVIGADRISGSDRLSVEYRDAPAARQKDRADPRYMFLDMLAR